MRKLTRRSKRAWATLVAGCVVLAFWIRLGPLPADLLDLGAHRGVRLLDRNGDLIYSTLAERGGRSQRIGEEDLTPAVADATLAAEDHRFFAHVGVDPQAILRAFMANVRAGRVVEGGSTITQQTIDLIRDDPESFAAKVREVVYALRLEHRLTKREILALYLSLAPYGNGQTGLVSASRFYFGVAPRDLTVAQAAYLAGLPRAPSRFNPLHSPALAQRRQREVLARMDKRGFIDAAVRLRAENETLALGSNRPAFLARHLVERVLELPKDPQETTLWTSLDFGLQKEIGGIIEAHRDRLTTHGASAIAVAVLDNRNGTWLAWEGSGNYFGPEGAMDGVITPRQPGSALKPFTYALAFERGLSPAQAIPDVPSTFPTGEEGILYKPQNYDGRFHGPLLARTALASSVNIPAIWTLSQIGVEPLLHRLRQAGFTTLNAAPDFYGYGLTMGNAEVPLRELVAAYAALARGGTWIEPSFLIDAPVRQRTRRVFDPLAAFLVSDILSDDRARELGFGRGSPLEFAGQRVAAKTGTSQNYHDNWAIGYTGDVTVGVWVGNFSRRALRNSSGITGAAPVFHSVMEAALRRHRSAMATQPFEPPPGLRRHELCAISGGAPTPYCPRQVREWLPASTSPAKCRWHSRGDSGGSVTNWPPEYEAWAREEIRRDSSNRVATTGPARSNIRASVSFAASGFAITSPPNGATYWMDPTLRREFQAVRLTVRGGRGPVRWRVDGRDYEPKQFLQWPLAPGRHRFEARDVDGRTAVTEIGVR